MTARDKVIDKYWIDFLVARKGDYTVERSRYAYFWLWYYNDLCEGSRQVAQQKWSVAQKGQSDE